MKNRKLRGPDRTRLSENKPRGGRDTWDLNQPKVPKVPWYALGIRLATRRTAFLVGWWAVRDPSLCWLNTRRGAHSDDLVHADLHLSPATITTTMLNKIIILPADCLPKIIFHQPPQHLAVSAHSPRQALTWHLSTTRSCPAPCQANRRSGRRKGQHSGSAVTALR
jgi:hypothetical protein